MSIQPMERRHELPTGRWYEQLLLRRIELGQLLVELLCHPEQRGLAAAVCDEVERLERRLERFDRYPEDYVARVMPAEDARWHTPPEESGQQSTGPCFLCVRLDLGAALGEVPFAVSERTPA